MRVAKHFRGWARVLAATLLTACAQEGHQFLETPSLEAVTVTQDFPAVVKVILPEGRGLCTGTQIAPRAVLTAAHCAIDAGAYRAVTNAGTRLTYIRENLGTGQLGDRFDLSLLVFSQDLGTESVSVSFDGVAPGDAVRIVGFGCDDLDSRLGTGVKRTGTNRITRSGDFLEIATPLNQTPAHRILGPQNLAGSCFGDSGGPMLRYAGGRVRLVGVAHAGGWNETLLVSRYVDLSRREIRDFLESADSRYRLSLFDPCRTEPNSVGCQVEDAAVGIQTFLGWIQKWIALLF